MIIYKDVMGENHDEIISDAYPMKLVDDLFYEVDCKMVSTAPIQVNTGANASAEEAEEELNDESEKVNNIIDAFKLQSTQFDKKSYGLYLKGYLKALAANMKEQGKADEEVKAFQDRIQAWFKQKLLPNFSDYEFLTGSSMNAEGMVVLLNYREDGITPYITLWKDGLKGEKF